VFKHCGRMLGYGRGEALDDATPPALDVAYGTVAVGETVEYDVIRIVEVVVPVSMLVVPPDTWVEVKGQTVVVVSTTTVV